MTEGTPSGKADRGIEPSSLVEMLAGDPAAVAVLALCSAERLSDIAENLVASPLAKRAVRTGLDLGWSAVADHDPRPDAIGRAISDLSELFGSPSNDVPEFQSELDNAIGAAIYALQAVREGNSIAAANAVGYCRDVYFQLAVRTWPGLKANALLGSSVVQDEVKREVNEAQTIAALDGTISAEPVESLRQAAHAHSKILVKLISGDPQEEHDDPDLSGQEPLF